MDYYFTISKLLTPLVLISNFLVGSLVISFYFGVLKNKIFFKKIFIILFVIFFVISVFPMGKLLTYYFLEKNFYKQIVPKNINFIFVPSGSQERLISAIDIKNKYKLEDVKILYSSGNPYLDKKNSIDQERLIINTIIENSKINPSDIIFLPEARNTFENIIRLNDYLLQIDKKNSKILLISQAFHLKRCLIISKKYNLNISGYASSYLTKNFSTGIVNSYQKACVTCNLSYIDRFFKESLSILFAKFSGINGH